MGARIINIAGLILLAYTLIACSAGSGLKAPSAGDNAALQGSGTDFELLVMDQTFIDGGQGKVTHRAVPTEDGYAVEVSVAGAQNLKALFFEMNYDELLWHPVDCISTNLLSDEAQPVVLNQLSEAGLVAHGQVIRNYNLHEGFTGDGVLARIQFAPGAAGKERKTSTLGTPYSATPTVYADYYGKSLRVYYNILGDYDNNGFVNLADIMPLALFFGNSSSIISTYGINQDGTVIDTPRTSPTFYVDGNGDGEINLADLSIIAIEYGNKLSGFDICASTDYVGNYPFDGSMTKSPAHVSSFSLPPSSGYDSEERGYWDFDLPAMEYANHYWVHPVSDNEQGRASMVAVDMGDYPPLFDKEFGLEYDTQESMLSWNSNLRGDMDSNSEVGLSDIQAMIINGSYLSAGPFQPDSIEWITDSNRDGVINMTDIAMVDLLFNNQENCLIYATLDSELVPQTPISPERLQPISDNYERDREGFSSRSFCFAEIDLESGTYVWIRVIGKEGDPGPRSEVIQIP